MKDKKVNLFNFSRLIMLLLSVSFPLSRKEMASVLLNKNIRTILNSFVSQNGDGK